MEEKVTYEEFGAVSGDISEYLKDIGEGTAKEEDYVGALDSFNSALDEIAGAEHVAASNQSE